MKKMFKAYVRVSTKSQSIENQKKCIEFIYGNMGHDIQYYEDIASGKNISRKGLFELLINLKNDDKIVVSELSRLTRNISDGLMLRTYFKEKNIRFICMDQKIDLLSDDNLDIFKALLTNYTHEIENTTQRIKTTMQMMKGNDELRARSPFGYKFVDKMVGFEKEPEQYKVLEKIRELHNIGLNYSQIARKLNEDGDNLVLQNNKRTKTDAVKSFYTQTIKRILNIDYDTRLTIGQRKYKIRQ